MAPLSHLLFFVLETRLIRFGMGQFLRNFLTVVSLLTFLYLPAQAGFCRALFGIFAPKKERISEVSVMELVELYQNEIRELMRYSPRSLNLSYSDKWSCDMGGCIPFSGQLQFALQSRGYKTDRIKVEGFYNDHPHLPSYSYHFFLRVLDQNSGKEIIIDPTYKQFFYKLDQEPSVFVGTRKQLENLFRRNIRSVHLMHPRDNKKELDPEGVVEMIYGYDRGEISSSGAPSRQYLSQPE